MKHTSCVLGMALLAFTGGSANAMESATVGSQAAQSTVSVLNSKIDTLMAALQAQLTSMTNCNNARKFYAPSDPKKDANGCVGVGDYDLNMASTSNINLANGRVNSTQGASNNWGGLFYGPANYGGVYGQAGIYGVYGVATGNGYGVVGSATNNSGGIGGQFSGGNSGVRAYGASYGVLANATNGLGVYSTSPNSWAGEFVGKYGAYGQGTTYGVYGYATASGGLGVVGIGPSGGWGGYFTGGVNISGQLCLNGSCATSMPAISCNFPGGFVDVHGDRGSCWDDMGVWCDSSGHVSAMHVCP